MASGLSESRTSAHSKAVEVITIITGHGPLHSQPTLIQSSRICDIIPVFYSLFLNNPSFLSIQVT